MWRLDSERPLIPPSSLIIPSAPAAGNQRADMLVLSSASYPVTHLGWEAFEENGAPVLVCQRTACGSVTDCRETWRRISLHAVRVRKTHTPSPQVMQLDQTPTELLRLSNTAAYLRWTDAKRKLQCEPFLKVEMTFLLSRHCSAFPKHINIELSFFKLRKIDMSNHISYPPVIWYSTGKKLDGLYYILLWHYCIGRACQC